MIDRLRAGLEAIVKAIVEPRIDYLALYPATIVGQDAAGKVELLPDNPRVRGQGLSSVPLRNGLPGFSCKVSSGSRVLLGFEDGSPSKPYAMAWAPSTGGDVTAVTFDDGDAEVARVGDSAGELYVDTIAMAAMAPSLWYRSPRGTGIWALVLTGAGPPIPLAPGTAVVIDEGNEKLLA